MKKILLITCLIYSCTSAQTPTITKWEHGYKGKYLTATRREMHMKEDRSDKGIKNISFDENTYMGKIDRAEIDAIIKKCGGWVMEGDYTGLHVILFDNIETKEQQDSVIKVVLPKLEKWYATNN